MAKRKQSGRAHYPPARKSGGPPAPAPLLDDLRALIRQAREAAAQAANAVLVLLYWRVGRRIEADILAHRRAAYGEQVVQTVSAQLSAEFGGGYSQPNLSRMVRFAAAFRDEQAVAALARHLTWSHFVEIIRFDDPLQRDFYAGMCRVERWGVRMLRARIQGMLFERTALSKKPAELARRELAALRDEDRLTPDLVFRDPYFLNFLGLADAYSEQDLEQAILRELESFILELGAGFAFVARQKRMVIGKKDYYLDLLFYHRILRRLVAVELKLGPFEADHKGQMELYLRWLERHEVQPGEEAPLGLILCADKDDEHVELLQLERSGIRIAAYLTDLPPRPLLEKKLHDAVRLARARQEANPATF